MKRRFDQEPPNSLMAIRGRYGPRCSTPACSSRPDRHEEPAALAPPRNGVPTAYAYDRADRITSAGGVGSTANPIRLDPRKIEVLEGLLHGTQRRRGWDRYLTIREMEVHVKRFMLRHRRLLGISDEDAAWLIRSLEMYR